MSENKESALAVTTKDIQNVTNSILVALKGLSVCCAQSKDTFEHHQRRIDGNTSAINDIRTKIDMMSKLFSTGVDRVVTTFSIQPLLPFCMLMDVMGWLFNTTLSITPALVEDGQLIFCVNLTREIVSFFNEGQHVTNDIVKKWLNQLGAKQCTAGEAARAKRLLPTKKALPTSAYVSMSWTQYVYIFREWTKYRSGENMKASPRTMIFFDRGKKPTGCKNCVRIPRNPTKRCNINVGSNPDSERMVIGRRMSTDVLASYWRFLVLLNPTLPATPIHIGFDLCPSKM